MITDDEFRQIVCKAKCKKCGNSVNYMGEVTGFVDKVLVQCTKCDEGYVFDKQSIIDNYRRETNTNK